jgi:hypothetical protein
MVSLTERRQKVGLCMLSMWDSVPHGCLSLRVEELFSHHKCPKHREAPNNVVVPVEHQEKDHPYRRASRSKESRCVATACQKTVSCRDDSCLSLCCSRSPNSYTHTHSHPSRIFYAACSLKSILCIAGHECLSPLLSMLFIILAYDCL